MKAAFITKDQNYNDETTIYWFEIIESDNSRIEAGETYGLSDCCGEYKIVDEENSPVASQDWEVLNPVLVPTDSQIND